MAIINKSTNNKWGRGEMGILMHCWWEWRFVQPLWKVVWRVLRNIEMELPYDPAILLLGVYLKKLKRLVQKNTCTPMFILSLFYNNQDMKATQIPISKWVGKKVMGNIYNRISLLVHKKNEILPFVTAWMVLEGITLSDISQTEKNQMISLICVI